MEGIQLDVSSGAKSEYSSGQNWADDDPLELKQPQNELSIINSGACGAFVHGLEDEMMGKNDY